MSTLSNNTTLTQKSDVLNHLIQRTTITDTQARSEYGIARLGARIWDIRQMGVEIETIPVTVLNRRGRKVRIAQYKLQSLVIPERARPLLDQDSLVWVGETF